MKRWKQYLMILAVLVFMVLGTQAVMAANIKIAVVDKDTGVKLNSAYMVILNSKGIPFTSWNASGEEHEVSGLEAGTTYTLREVVAPKEYSVARDEEIIINDDGTVSYSGTKGNGGILLVENTKATGNGEIKIMIYTLRNRKAFKVSNQTFRVALFSDKELKNRVSSVWSVSMKNVFHAEIKFPSLAYGTYYVAETDLYGNGKKKSSSVINAEIRNQPALLSGKSRNAETIILNDIHPGVVGAYENINLKVNLNIVNNSGKAMNAKDTFWFALFSDKSCTQRVAGTSIESIELNDASSGSTIFWNLPYSDFFYVAEVDKGGVPVKKGQNDFKYHVSYRSNGFTYGKIRRSSVTVTNKSDDMVDNKITLQPPKSVKAKAKKNKVTVSWKKITDKNLLKEIKSIEVQYSTNKKFTKNVKTKRNIAKTKTKVTLKLKKRKTYYIRVRYKGANGYSEWSKVTKVKTKK